MKVKMKKKVLQLEDRLLIYCLHTHAHAHVSAQQMHSQRCAFRFQNKNSMKKKNS